MPACALECLFLPYNLNCFKFNQTSMKESAKSFTNGLMESMTLYWNKFLLALPRIAMAIILLVIVFYIASYIARLLKRRLSGEDHDPLFVRFLSKKQRSPLLFVDLFWHCKL